MPIRFPFDHRKAVEVICWLVREQPGIDLYTIVKAIYYAEKKHLLSYGRPIVGDKYFAMDHGMVPSAIYDALKQEMPPRRRLRAAIGDAIRMEIEDYPRYYPLRDPDEELLSGSDIRCLRHALDRCSGLSFTELRALAHTERAWREAWNRRPPERRAIEMDYEAIIDDDLPQRERLIRELRESAETMVL